MGKIKASLRSLEYLVALADCRHFSRAASHCSVSQPTLSAQIRKLEDLLGVALIERNTSQLLLTRVGEKIVAQARKALYEARCIEQIAESSRDPFGGKLKLGVIPTVAPYLLPQIIGELRKAFPDLDVYYTEAQTVSLEEQLKSGVLDAALLALPVTLNDFRDIFLYREDFYLVTPDNHPLAKKSVIDLKDLKRAELLLLEDGHCFRDQALEVCRLADAVQNMNFSATSIETLKQMVAARLGLTLIPEMAVSKGTEHLGYVPFTVPPCRRIGIVFRKSTTRVSLLAELSEVIKAKAQQVLDIKSDSFAG